MVIANHPDCGRDAIGRRMQTLLIGVCVCALVAGCAPYPMYNNAPDHSAEIGRRGDSDDDAGRVSVQHARLEDDSDVDEQLPSTVDPRIFKRVIETYLGVPYSMGGRDLDGIDCSNLVRLVYRDYAGKRLPSSTRSLFRLPVKISQSQLQVGDLVFFSFSGSHSPDHVGMYMGEGRFALASESRGVVYSSMATPHYRDAYRGARRVM